MDAHDGAILYYYSANPLLDVPTKLHGKDEAGVDQPFFGRKMTSSFALDDPLRGIQTHDLQFGDITSPAFLFTAVDNALADFASTNTAAVSAHVNATRVDDFYKVELS